MTNDLCDVTFEESRSFDTITTSVINSRRTFASRRRRKIIMKRRKKTAEKKKKKKKLIINQRYDFERTKILLVHVHR